MIKKIFSLILFIIFLSFFGIKNSFAGFDVVPLGPTSTALNIIYGPYDEIIYDNGTIIYSVRNELNVVLINNYNCNIKLIIKNNKLYCGDNYIVDLGINYKIINFTSGKNIWNNYLNFFEKIIIDNSYITISDGVIKFEQTGITKVMDASTKAIKSGFGVLDFLGVIALIVGAGFVIRYILGLIPKALSGGGGSSK